MMARVYSVARGFTRSGRIRPEIGDHISMYDRWPNIPKHLHGTWQDRTRYALHRMLDRISLFVLDGALIWMESPNHKYPTYEGLQVILGLDRRVDA